MAITIKGGRQEPNRSSLEHDGNQAVITRNGALKVDATHTIQTIKGQVEVTNDIKVTQPIKTEELNTAREITSLPAIKIDPSQNTVRATIEEPLDVRQVGEVITRIANASLPIKGDVKVTDLPLPLSPDRSAMAIAGQVQVLNFPRTQGISGTVQVEQVDSDKLNANVRIRNLPLPVVNQKDNPLEVDGVVTLKAGAEKVGVVDVGQMPAVKLDGITTNEDGRLQVDIVSQPKIKMDQIQIDPRWNTVRIENLPDTQSVRLVDNTLELSARVQDNLKNVSARVTNDVLTVRDISDKKSVAVLNWPQKQAVSGTVNLPFETVQDLKLIQVDNFPAVQDVSVPAAHLDSLGRWMVKVDKMPVVQIDDSTPIRVDTELTIDGSDVTLDTVKTVEKINALGSIIEPITISDTTPVKVNVIDLDDITFTNESIKTHEQHAYSEELDTFKVSVLEEPDVVRKVQIVDQPLDVELTNVAIDLDKHQQVDIIEMPPIPAGTNKIGSVDANITNKTLEIEGVVTLDEATLRSLGHTTVTIDNIPEVQDVKITNGVLQDKDGHGQVDIVSLPKVTLDEESLLALEHATVTVDNLPENQDVTVTNFNLDSERRLNVNINEMPVIRIDDSVPIKVDTELYIDNAVVGLDRVDLVNTIGEIKDPVLIDDSRPIKVENIGIADMVLKNAYDPSTDLLKVQVEAEPEVRDVNIINDDLPISGSVRVDNLPEVQEVCATELDIRALDPEKDKVAATIDNSLLDVQVLNFPGTQEIVGSVSVDTMPPIGIDQEANTVVVSEVPEIPSGDNLIGRVKLMGSDYEQSHNEMKINSEGEQFVKVVNLPDLREVTGEVSISNLPAIQQVEVTNPEVRDESGRLEVTISNIPSVNIDNTDLTIRQLTKDHDSVAVYGADGNTKKAIKTDRAGRLETVMPLEDSFDIQALIDDLRDGSTGNREYIIPNGQAWVLQYAGISSSGRNTGGVLSSTKTGAELTIFWDPDGENRPIRKISSGAMGGTAVSPMNVRLVGDGVKKIRLHVRNIGGDRVDAGAWFGGYVE